MLGLVAGIGLEVYGFSLRVRISGWAPVTNMYETVIWVALVAAVLGLVFELIYRKTFAALAGSGVALLGTVLAANVPLLDPSIKSLQPVLRSNYWLTIHVLTEVSSYAAFALAMGLGLIATIYYLTATYRRSPGFLELALPADPGPAAAGRWASVGVAASYGAFGPRWLAGPATRCSTSPRRWRRVGGVADDRRRRRAASARRSAGLTFREDAGLDDAALAGERAGTRRRPSVQTVTVGEASGGRWRP